MEDLVKFSYQHCYRRQARDILDDDVSSSQAEIECGTENVVRVKCILSSYEPLLSHAIRKLLEAKLKLDIVNIDVGNSTPTPCDSSQVERRLSDKLTVLVNDIDIAMKNLSYGLYRGKVYRKVDHAKYTFSFKCDVRAFVNSLATNEFYKARLLGNMRKVIDLMSDPYCEVICPLLIDYDLIEVNDGLCWSIRQRKFIECPIPDNRIGQISPRAFCQYDSSREPDPKYFKQILENSLDPREQAEFCEDFLRLLHYNRKHHKDKVPCLAGESNSGKSSLFFPILGIVHHSNIATVTKQRAFNKAMITKFTEVIFIDEATETTLSIDDWKILTQGGFAAFDVKYETARAFINRCPMLITTQKKLNFGGEDQKAMEKRLRMYTFKSLAEPKKRAADWLKQHPMECIVWAAAQAATLSHGSGNDGDDDRNSSNDESLELQDDDGELDEKEKESLRLFTPFENGSHAVPDHPNPDAQCLEVAEEHQSETDDRLLAVETALKNTNKDTLRYRHAQELREKERERIAENQRQYQRKQERYKALGVSTQNMELVPKEDVPNPTPINLDLRQFAEKQRNANQEARRLKCRSVFQEKWLRDAEMKMHDCVKTVNESLNASTKEGARGVIEIYSNKLKLHHTGILFLFCSETYAHTTQLSIFIHLLLYLFYMFKQWAHGPGLKRWTSDVRHVPHWEY